MEGLVSTEPTLSSFTLISELTSAKLGYPYQKNANIYIFFRYNTFYMQNISFFEVEGRGRIFLELYLGCLYYVYGFFWGSFKKIIFPKLQHIKRYRFLYNIFNIVFYIVFACKTSTKRVNKSFARVYKKVIYAKVKLNKYFCLKKTSLQVLFVCLLINDTKSLQTLKEKKKKYS